MSKNEKNKKPRNPNAAKPAAPTREQRRNHTARLMVEPPAEEPIEESPQTQPSEQLPQPAAAAAEPAAPEAANAIARRTISFSSKNAQEIADRLFRGRKARQINFKATLEQRFGLQLDKIEGNNKPIAAITFPGTRAQETQLETFFQRAIRNINKNSGSIIEKQLKLIIDDVKGEGPQADPLKPRYNVSARQKKHSQPERTIRLQHEVSKANNHGEHSPGLQASLRKIFVDKKGNGKTVADVIRNKLHLTDLSVDDATPITHVKITARADEEIEYTKTLLNRILADTRFLNGEGMDMRLREKRLDDDIANIRNGKPVHTVAYGKMVLANQEKKAAGAQQPANDAGAEQENANALAAITHKNDRQKAQLEAFRPKDGEKPADCIFAFGEAGTGKTFLSMAVMADLLQRKKISHIVITRPVVEAGNQKLGFLPGDLNEKVAPYMVPMAQALAKVYKDEEKADAMIEEKRLIKVVPLAYMRGINIDRAGVILDEAQNATYDEIKMVLTRTGPGTKLAVNGDPSQTDLKPKSLSGLRDWAAIMKDDPGTVTVRYLDEDVVRSDFVKRVVAAEKRHFGQNLKPQFGQAATAEEKLAEHLNLQNPDSLVRRLLRVLTKLETEALGAPEKTFEKQATNGLHPVPAAGSR